MAITNIHHVQITVPPADADDARSFYCELLGLAEINKPQALAARGGFWVRIGNQQLHIGVENGVDRAATKAHVAYEVDDLDAWRIRLAAAGIEIRQSMAIPGYDRFECRDPFGNRIEFISSTR